MKKYNIVLFILIPIFLQAQEQSFILKGEIRNLEKPAELFLMTYSNPLNPPDKIIDSTYVSVNGSFVFKGKIQQPVKAQLVLKHSMKINKKIRSMGDDRLDFYLENGRITFEGTDSIINAKVKGGIINKDYNSLKQILTPIDSEYIRQYKALSMEWIAASDSVQKSKEFQRNYLHKSELIKEHKKLALSRFIGANPRSIVSLDALLYLLNFSGAKINKQIDSLFNLLSPKIQNSDAGKKLANRIKDSNKLNIGSIAPLFSQRDTSGKEVKLADYHGKYVLIEFWASWCGGCRQEAPNLVSSYKKYNKSNFTIISISLDDGKSQNAWRKAIINDGTFLWSQLSDLKGWNNSVAKLYSIHAIPQNFLVDPNGNIIAKDLRGQDLDDKLLEIFGDD